MPTQSAQAPLATRIEALAEQVREDARGTPAAILARAVARLLLALASLIAELEGRRAARVALARIISEAQAHNLPLPLPAPLPIAEERALLRRIRAAVAAACARPRRAAANPLTHWAVTPVAVSAPGAAAPSHCRQLPNAHPPPAHRQNRACLHPPTHARNVTIT